MAKKSELSQVWVDYITPFAAALSIETDDATKILKSIAGDPGDSAIALLKDAAMTPDDAIKAAMPEGTALGIQNKAVSLLREVDAPAVPANATALAYGSGLSILPEVPDDGSWLEALKAGGTLKVQENDVISAVRAGLASRVGLFQIPQKIVEAMEAHTDDTLEQVDERFFKLRKQLTRVNYGEIFSAIEGLDKSYVTEARKKKLLERLNAHFWPAVMSYHTQLKGWVESWQQGAANPALMMNAMAQMVAGGGVGGMPPGMMAPPDTGGLRDAASAMNDDINRVFAGTGVVTARALAFEANQIKESISDSAIPTLIGVANRDQMLRKLGVDVSANYTRMETNLTKYVMSVMNMTNVSAEEETTYFSSLYMLGSQIPWDDIGVGATVHTLPSRRVSGGSATGLE